MQSNKILTGVMPNTHNDKSVWRRPSNFQPQRVAFRRDTFKKVLHQH